MKQCASITLKERTAPIENQVTTLKNSVVSAILDFQPGQIVYYTL